MLQNALIIVFEEMSVETRWLIKKVLLSSAIKFFEGNVQGSKTWDFLGESCFRSLIVFLSRHFVT